MKRISLLATLAVACTFSACKKDDDKPKSKADTLTSHEWMLSAATASVTVGGATQTMDMMNSNSLFALEDCDKDNVLSFASAGTYAVSEGATSCTPPTAETGKWSLNSDATKLTRTPQGGTDEVADVMELTDSSLKLSTSDNSYGTPILITLTFRKK